MELKPAGECHLRLGMRLLIVPYGIETRSNFIGKIVADILLIVPYGIETRNSLRSLLRTLTFNRTLWN